MRALLFATLCLSMAVCIIADFEIGQRQDGDHLITNMTMCRPRIPFVSSTVPIRVETKSPDERISDVQISTIGDQKASFRTVRGGVGKNYAEMLAVGEPGKGLCVRVEAYAISTITSPVPTITSVSEVTTTEVNPTNPVSDKE